MRRSSLRWTIPVFLALQLGLLWLQGAQLHRQNQVLQGLREDIQSLAESLENNSSAMFGDEEGALAPAHHRLVSAHFWNDAPPKQQQVAVLGAEEEQESAAKELKASKDSAQKAVKDSREAQAQLSLEENARKAEETSKVQAATHTWQRWFWGALALVALAFMTRSVIRRRG